MNFQPSPNEFALTYGRTGETKRDMDGLVRKHLERHGDDPARCLESLGARGSSGDFEWIASIADEARSGAGGAPPDPYATIPFDPDQPSDDLAPTQADPFATRAHDPHATVDDHPAGPASDPDATSVAPSSGTQNRLFAMPKKSVFPGGTVHSLTAVPPNVPPRNHTLPSCPREQSTAPSSVIGFPASGNDSAHCHQASPHSP